MATTFLSRKFTETDWGQPGQWFLQGPEYCTGGPENGLAASFRDPLKGDLTEEKGTTTSSTVLGLLRLAKGEEDVHGEGSQGSQIAEEQAWFLGTEAGPHPFLLLGIPAV